jgi:valyl-tRNA synthetase
MVAWVRDEIVKLLHPFMPFITEELWAVTAPAAQGYAEGGARETALILTRWPELEGLDAPDAEAEIGWLIDLVTAIRSLRVETNVPPATLIPLVLVNSAPETVVRVDRWADFLKRLARLSDISFADVAPANAVQLVVRGETAALPLAGVIDVAAERARLQKEIGKVDADIARVDAKLANDDFLRRAPEEVIDGEREKREEAQARRSKILEALERLQSAG